MSKALIIVESPTKARTIEKFLGKEYEVKASYGHVRDLPNNASEVPEKLKKEKWSNLGIDVENGFEPLYVIPDKKKKQVKELKDSLKDAEELYLATDEDREGESISWHLLQVLKPKIPVKRLVFHEITKATIKKALDSTRDVDDNLVRAQETRRLIDRLFGYSLSPLLWKKMAPRLSAGRVQSVALRLLVEKERKRVSFMSGTYWDLDGLLKKQDGTPPPFSVALTHVDGKRIAAGKDFDPDTGKLLEKPDVFLLDETQARLLKEQTEKETPKVTSVEEKPFVTKPYAPFTTSTLQQEGSRKLGFGAKRTMQVAQKLYENGFITYMRTDSTNLSEEALAAARSLIQREFGADYLPGAPIRYKTKVKNAQEAHEAIRPAGSEFASIEKVKSVVGIEGAKLYELIWKRTIASQMTNARGTRVSVKIQAGRATFRASGKTIEFAGFLRAYVEGADDPEAELADKETLLPKLSEGENLNFEKISAEKHETKPPARYTEGSLIKELEKLGIGRPSTWAAIVDIVLSKNYAFKKGTALVPSFLAMAIIRLMENHFKSFVDYTFTARLEADLDAISRGEADDRKYLHDFYFGEDSAQGLEQLVKVGEENIDPRLVCGLPLISLHDSTLPTSEEETKGVIEVRIGRYGPFLTDGETRCGVPEDVPPDEMTLERAKELLEQAAKGPDSLGEHPTSGKPVFLKTGRFGPYVQEGEIEEGGDKPKMASLLAGMEPSEVTLELALQLLSLPRELGTFDGNNEPIIAANGRYGPYVKAGSETRSIPAELSPLSITPEQAIDLLRQPKARGRRAAAAPKALKEMGKHPVTELNLVVKSGRYGPYVTDGEINASLPKGKPVEELTLEEAVNLIDARANKLGDKKKKKKTTTKKKSATKKKTTTKKKVESKSSK